MTATISKNPLVAALQKKWRRTTFMGVCWKIVRAIILLGLCFVVLYPFFFKIVNGLKSFNDFLDPTVRFLPKEPTLENFITAFQKMDYLHSLLRTVIVSTSCCLLQTAISAMVGYGFARFHFKGNGLLFGCVMLVLLVPPQTLMIPLYQYFRFFLGTPLSLINSYWPVLILSVTGMGLRNGLYVFMFRQFFRNMPKELEEAAYIDGCAPFHTFRSVMLPSARPIITTVALFSFSWQWTDEFYNELFFSSNTVLANAVQLTVNTHAEPVMDSMLQNVAAILAVAPLALLYLIAQRSFVQSMERSGIVG